MSDEGSGDLEYGGDGRRLRWLAHNQARRRVIIDAAIRVLERSEPGDDVQVQLIAEEAGLARTVLYRHFHDRVDLDVAVQQQICKDLGKVILPALSFDGTPIVIIRRIIDAVVRWATDHPTLFWFIELELPGPGPHPLAVAIEALAEQIEQLMNTVVQYDGVELSADDRAGLDPWVFGLIGQVFASIRRWTSRLERAPKAEQLVNMLAESIWLQINGMATARGIDVPNVSLAELIRVAEQS
ncbi:TetR/AcrR family transcriptional regulator [Nocardioides bizhenqiangii]|uniref:TetR/AcrR family transcriptional regulator n=1 Tax=Nocardioides bizhenqiangii TaxID=3095076 RepID=A0ABZ0ZWH9_9ACTN|nr:MULTISPECIES: TetR/AcrR family transcriptional regulator [unclassified Nocardioides]MDZ5622231.1 TetR/AcrR family transcriptional regulator [Nocardioides sp. HM23]WQQ28593.1 TetR/AcrR family transcriptional regulator [Nocardioides sp. HM61]